MASGDRAFRRGLGRMLGGIALIILASALALLLQLLVGSSYSNASAIEFLLLFLLVGSFLVLWGYWTLAAPPEP